MKRSKRKRVNRIGNSTTKSMPTQKNQKKHSTEDFLEDSLIGIGSALSVFIVFIVVILILVSIKSCFVNFMIKRNAQCTQAYVYDVENHRRSEGTSLYRFEYNGREYTGEYPYHRLSIGEVIEVAFNVDDPTWNRINTEVGMKCE
ncbi:MAG: hypothetical protein MJZ34_16160 [Paludibacteraceae bacterium]|nr:hypothetical protein [Paludibacteraceae bacterium]